MSVPGGMLLNELLKILVHRQRPFLAGAVCGLVCLQFCEWPHDWSDSPLRPTRAFYLACAESAPLAGAKRFQRRTAGRLGGIQSHRFGRAFFDRCARGNRFWDYLADVLLNYWQANAAK